MNTRNDKQTMAHEGLQNTADSDVFKRQEARLDESQM